MLLDGQPVHFQREADIFIVEAVGPCRTVCLQGMQTGKPITSGEAWIDNEAALAIAHTIRSFAANITEQVSPKNWNVGVWAEILRLFYEHLEYTPTAGHAHQVKTTAQKKDAPRDIFTDDYGKCHQLPIGLAERLTGMRGEVLGFLGYTGWRYDGGHGNTDQSTDTDANEARSGKETVDKEKQLSQRRAHARPAVSDLERRTGARRASLVVKLLTSVEYLRRREPKQIGVDLVAEHFESG